MPKKYTQQKVKMLLKRESEVWIYSYADLITNLLAFFLVFAAAKTGSPEVAQKIQDSLAKVTDKYQKGDISNAEFANMISQYIESQQLPRGTSVIKSVDGVALTFSGGVFFESLSADLTRDAKVALEQIVPLIKKLPPSMRIDVSGHTDRRPINDDMTYMSNWDLSSARAASVVRYLETNGVQRKRMRAIGYSDTRSISSDDNLNRRVVIRIGRLLPD